MGQSQSSSAAVGRSKRFGEPLDATVAERGTAIVGAFVDHAAAHVGLKRGSLIAACGSWLEMYNAESGVKYMQFPELCLFACLFVGANNFKLTQRHITQAIAACGYGRLAPSLVWMLVPPHWLVASPLLAQQPAKWSSLAPVT